MIGTLKSTQNKEIFHQIWVNCEVPEIYSENYKSEAAIINYYPMDSTLSGHVDFSEPNKTAPLISISFGQSAIFLIGGPNKNIKPSGLVTVVEF